MGTKAIKLGSWDKQRGKQRNTPMTGVQSKASESRFYNNHHQKENSKFISMKMVKSKISSYLCYFNLKTWAFQIRKLRYIV